MSSPPLCQTKSSNRFSLCNYRCFTCKERRKLVAVVFVPSPCWLSILGGKQNPQLAARGPTHSGLKESHCALADQSWKLFQTKRLGLDRISGTVILLKLVKAVGRTIGPSLEDLKRKLFEFMLSKQWCALIEEPPRR